MEATAGFFGDCSVSNVEFYFRHLLGNKNGRSLAAIFVFLITK